MKAIGNIWQYQMKGEAAQRLLKSLSEPIRAGNVSVARCLSKVI